MMIPVIESVISIDRKQSCRNLSWIHLRHIWSLDTRCGGPWAWFTAAFSFRARISGECQGKRTIGTFYTIKLCQSFTTFSTGPGRVELQFRCVFATAISGGAALPSSSKTIRATTVDQQISKCYPRK